MNSGIITSTAILALEIRTTKVDLAAKAAMVGMAHPMDMVKVMDIITTSFEKG
jgi:hypothetical protein